MGCSMVSETLSYPLNLPIGRLILVKAADLGAFTLLLRLNSLLVIRLLYLG